MIEPHQPIPGQNQTTSRSTFVTTLAWNSIVLGGFATFISLLQNIMFNVFFPLSDMQEIAQGKASSQLPWIAKFMFANMRLFFGGFFVVSVATLIASVGLLRRRNWARLAFIGLMALGIIWNVGALLVQQLMFSSISFPGPRADGPREFSVDFETMATVIQVFSVVMTVALSALSGWILWRLTSKPIAAEFRSGGSGST